jgi:hypothetical protein
VPSVEILATGWIDRRDSSFPQSVQLPNGDILCSFNVGDGPSATGGSDWARSTDGGQTWTVEGTILPPTEDPPTGNALKLSLSHDAKTIYAYGSRSHREEGERFGEGTNQAIVCMSIDGGQSWSPPSVVPMQEHNRLEISHAALPLSSGRVLAPAATLPGPGRLGEQVLVAVSDDGGTSWPRHSVVFEDPEKKNGYFEQKLAEISPSVLIAVCWTVTLDKVDDLEDHFVLSHDDGLTWSTPRSTGIRGQTMTPIPLGGDRLLVLYNRRYGEQGIVMNLVTFTETEWSIQYEGILYDGKAKRDRPTDIDTGVDELDSFMFGFPTAIKLQDGTHLATHWCNEDGKFGVRWTKLRVDW